MPWALGQMDFHCSIRFAFGFIFGLQTRYNGVRIFVIRMKSVSWRNKIRQYNILFCNNELCSNLHARMH